MDVSRRTLLLRGLVVTAAGTAAARDTALFASRAADREYRSTLVNGLTPSHYFWNGRKWRCNMGSTRHRGLDYCFQVTERAARFEIRDTSLDGDGDRTSAKRRSEISGSVYGDKTRLPNGMPLWGAMSFIHHSWSDPSGMAKLHGGVHGQIHIGSKFGGSPALAFRRNASGQFVITTRGEFDLAGTSRYRETLAFDEVHDVVYRVVLHETHGELDVWLNGRHVVQATAVSIGSHLADSYWNLGCYYAGGVSCPVVAEFANHVYPSARELSRRPANPPSW